MLTTSMVLFGQQDNGGGAIATVVLLFQLVVLVLVLASYWVLFTKAGKPGWASLIPIYNLVVMLQIVGRPIWWILLFLIPCVNIAVIVILMIDLAKSYGKDAAWGIGLLLLGIVFLPLLAFGDSKYVGPAAAK